MNKLGKTIVSALHTGGSLATSVRYFYVLGFVPGLGVLELTILSRGRATAT